MPPIPPRYKQVGAPLPGGMGTVVICKDEVLERKVAIKFIQAATDPRRLLDEVSALLKLRSKHIVQVYDLIRYGAKDFGIIQEFIDGKDLLESYKAPTTVEQYYKSLWQIAAGIADIHSVNLIHRDIKPNNMKTDPEGVIKIFDFGLARDAGPSASTVGFVGTRGFAAPELYSGAPKFTKAVDTYAFGATALYLATGRLPKELLAQPPTRAASNYFASLPLGLAPEIAAALDTCLAAKASGRPSMSEVRDLLASHLLFEKHRALVVYNGKPSSLNVKSPTVRLELPSIGTIEIRYSGLAFEVADVSGEIFVNSGSVVAGSRLPGCCVIAFGAAHRGSQRKYVTLDVSHPEIVL